MGDVLLALCESNDEFIAKRASTILVRFFDDLTDAQAERYFNAGFVHFAEKRDRYPLGIDVAIGLGFRLQFGHEGLPKDRKYKFKTTTRHFLDDKEFGEPYRYESHGAASGYVKLKEQPLGRHRIRMTTVWEFKRGERTLKGSFETTDLDFEITAADTPDNLVAEPDPELTKTVQEAVQFRESDSSFQRRSQFRPRSMERDWRPTTYTLGKDGTGPVYTLHTPAWRMNRLLPVDLAYQMNMKVEGTGIEIPCYDAIVLAGERTYTRHVHTAGPLDELVQRLLKHADKNGFVKVRIALTPSRKTALENPKIKKYFPETITSEVLRIRVSTSTTVPPNLPPPDPQHQQDDDNG